MARSPRAGHDRYRFGRRKGDFAQIAARTQESASTPERISVPMNSRQEILQRIHERIAAAGPMRDQFAPAAMPPEPDVWPATHPDRGAMAERFANELSAVHGEVIRLRNLDEAARQFAALVEQERWTALAAAEDSLLQQVTARVPREAVRWINEQESAQQMAAVSAGLLAADALLADTGSCVISCPTVQHRWLCYVPPVCIVAAKAERLCEHLPAAWPLLSEQASDPQRRGETVIVTGPSRTADIEKILILGVHGPKRLIVLLIDE